MCINNDPVTDLMQGQHRSHTQKTIKMSQKGKNFQEMDKWQNIEY